MKTYHTPSATIVVERIDWRTTVVAVSTADCRRPAEFRMDRSGKRAAAWLAHHDLTGLVWAGMTWAELEAAVKAPRAVPGWLADVQAERAREAQATVQTTAQASAQDEVPAATTEEVARLVERLVTQRVEEVITEHYAWVLAEKSRRAVVAKMLRDANALEAAAKIRDAGR